MFLVELTISSGGMYEKSLRRLIGHYCIKIIAPNILYKFWGLELRGYAPIGMLE
jgi:hypothetical protein